jgi:hypothetical protein
MSEAKRQSPQPLRFEANEDRYMQISTENLARSQQMKGY